MRKTNGETVKKEKRNTDFVKLIVIFSAMLVLFTFTGCLGCDCASEWDNESGNCNNLLLCENCVCNNSCLGGQVCNPWASIYGVNCIGDDYNIYTGFSYTYSRSDNDTIVAIFCGSYSYDTSILEYHDATECFMGCADCTPFIETYNDPDFGKFLPKEYKEYKAKEKSGQTGCGG